MPVSVRNRTLLNLVVAAGLTASVEAPPAAAGTYDVAVCGGGPNYTWRNEINHGGMTTYPNPTGCDSTGLVARHVGQPQGWTVPNGAAARWFFSAPSGAAIVGLAMKARFDTHDRRWQAALSNGSQILRGCPWGRDTCAVDLDGSYFDVPASGTIYTEVYCVGGPCPAYWQPDGWFGNVFGRAIIYSASVRIADGSPPAVTGGRGTAWTGDWISGTRTVTFDAADNTGIAAVETLIGGVSTNAASRSCDGYMLTCPNWDGATLEVNTRVVGDGTHRLAVAATDRGSNAGQADREVHVDNTPPSAPLELAAPGTGTWTRSSKVQLKWTNPRQEYAPIAGASFSAYPAGASTGCSTGDRDGKETDSLDVELPKPGRWDLRVWLKDAAGNVSRENAGAPLSVGFDPDPPETVAIRMLDPEDPSRVRVAAVDGLSGVARGEVEMRREGEAVWRSLSTVLEDGGFAAAIPDGDLRDGRYELRARAWDAAGNERSTDVRANGSRAEVVLPLRVKTRMLVGRTKRVRARGSRRHRRLRTVYVSRPLLRPGRRVRLSGRLLAPGGNPLAGVPVEVSAQLDAPGALLTAVATLTSSRTGRFSYVLPAGPSRVVRFHYAGAAKIRPQTRVVHVRVRAASSMRASRRHVVTGDPVVFRGRLRTGPLPATGKLVELQYFDRGRWRTFRTVRAAASSGRWGSTYRFTGTTGRRTYRFRARVPRENGYPYAPGTSRSVRVTVRGL